MATNGLDFVGVDGCVRGCCSHLSRRRQACCAERSGVSHVASKGGSSGILLQPLDSRVVRIRARAKNVV